MRRACHRGPPREPPVHREPPGRSATGAGAAFGETGAFRHSPGRVHDFIQTKNKSIQIFPEKSQLNCLYPRLSNLLKIG